jgi:hypothetical protein
VKLVHLFGLIIKDPKICLEVILSTCHYVRNLTCFNSEVYLKKYKVFTHCLLSRRVEVEIIIICTLEDSVSILSPNLVNFEVFVIKEIRDPALNWLRKISSTYFQIRYSLPTDIRRYTNSNTVRSVQRAIKYISRRNFEIQDLCSSHCIY